MSKNKKPDPTVLKAVNDQQAKKAVKPKPAPSKIVLADEAREQIHVAMRQMTDAKLGLANATILQQRALAIAVQAEQAVQEAVATAAKAHGIDPNDTSRGRWNFEVDTGTFELRPHVQAAA